MKGVKTEKRTFRNFFYDCFVSNVKLSQLIASNVKQFLFYKECLEANEMFCFPSDNVRKQNHNQI
jgi:hypothetical protein